MTNRIQGFVVTLEDNMRADDAESLRQAIRQLRGVGSVHDSVADAGAYIAQEQARLNLADKLVNVLYPKGPTK